MASTRVTVGVDSDSSDVGDYNHLESEGKEDDGEENGNGITDVMSKILGNKVPTNKGTILARGQTDREIQRKKKLKRKASEGEGSQAKKKKKKAAAPGDGKMSSSDWSDDSDDGSRQTNLQMKKRREWENMARVKPSVLTKDRERLLQRIATRGVVQVFNAVRQQQNQLGERMNEAGSSVRRRDKVLGSLSKKSFLDLLGSQRPKDGAESKEAASKTQQDRSSGDPESRWSILHDEYMQNARMKDWDVS